MARKRDNGGLQESTEGEHHDYLTASEDNGEVGEPAEQSVPVNEKMENFNRLASGRVSRAIDALSSLRHLANTQSYDWTDDAVNKIFSTLREKIDTVESSFVAAKAPSDGKKRAAKSLSFRL